MLENLEKLFKFQKNSRKSRNMLQNLKKMVENLEKRQKNQEKSRKMSQNLENLEKCLKIQKIQKNVTKSRKVLENLKNSLIISPFRDQSHPSSTTTTFRFDCSNLFNMAWTALDK